MLDDLANEQCSQRAERAVLDMLDNEQSEQCSRRAERAVLDMLDSELSEQEESPLVYRSPKHDFLMNCVQLILSFDLLLRLLKLQFLAIK